MKLIAVIALVLSSLSIAFPDVGLTPNEKAQIIMSYRDRVKSGQFDIEVSAEKDGPGKIIEAIRTIRSEDFAAERAITETCAKDFINETLSAHTAVGLQVKAVSSKHQIIDRKLSVVIRVDYQDPTGRMNPDPANWKNCAVTGLQGFGF